MNNLPASIKSLFLNLSPDFVLSRDNAFSLLSSKDFNKLNYHDEDFAHRSPNEIENLYTKLNEDWFIDPYIANNWQNGKSETNHFHILNHFTQKVLVEENLEPYVVYKNLLEWRDLSHQIGEDLLTTSFLAYCDSQSRRKRSFFAWRTTAFSNNKRLRVLLKKGMAENHFHLQGSGPIFPLTWLNLMNNPFSKENKKKLAAFDKEIKLSGLRDDLINEQPELKILIYKAATIRIKLFQAIQKITQNKEFNNTDSNTFSKYNIHNSSTSNESHELLLNCKDIEGDISYSKINAHQFIYKGKKQTMDYAIPCNVHEDNLDKALFLYGERKFLYDCFSLIYSGNQHFKNYQNLFHAYLLIKSRFRAEFIQINSKPGFTNFSEYQDRKSLFIKDDLIYYASLFNRAINESKNNQEIKSFELRFTPKNDVNRMVEVIKDFNQVINPKAIVSKQSYKIEESLISNTYHLSDENIFFTLHFIKAEENIKDDISESILPRNNATRKIIKEQADAIVKLREKEINLLNEKRNWSSLIKGIDAASSEFNARPEVFAQAFRFLKNHQLRGEANNVRTSITENKIFATFHAGEDFYDVVDGLRTIDEVIHFLDYRQGDRLGHALALGIDAEEYFNYKKNTLILPKQILLDNIAWLLARVRKFGIEGHAAEISRLEKLFSNLFNEIYTLNFSHNKNEFSIYTYTMDQYFDAWKLRGDDPKCYENVKDKVENHANLTYWERCAINRRYPKNNNIRDNRFTIFLYHQYHYNPDVKKVGAKPTQFYINPDYVKLVTAVQKGMQNKIKKRNIAIETNPSSNYLIGTFKDYSKHPLVNFYNLDLETDTEKVKNCPQLFVSINTDDQGVFSTSLENDYALIASALEQTKDEFGQPKYNPSMIYRWLDNIREMGLEQSFSNFDKE